MPRKKADNSAFIENNEEIKMVDEEEINVDDDTYGNEDEEEINVDDDTYGNEDEDEDDDTYGNEDEDEDDDYDEGTGIETELETELETQTNEIKMINTIENETNGNGKRTRQRAPEVELTKEFVTTEIAGEQYIKVTDLQGYKVTNTNKQVNIKVPVTVFNKMREQCEKSGLSTNRFCLEAINDMIEKTEMVFGS